MCDSTTYRDQRHGRAAGGSGHSLDDEQPIDLLFVQDGHDLATSFDLPEGTLFEFGPGDLVGFALTERIAIRICPERNHITQLRAHDEQPPARTNWPPAHEPAGPGGGSGGRSTTAPVVPR